MGKSKINVDELADAVIAQLKEFKGLTRTIVNNAVQETAKATVSEIREAARSKFGGTGGYAESWKMGKQKTDKGRYSTFVYASGGFYRLTHLLEDGHALVKGGRKIGEVKGREHIETAEKNAIDMLERLIKEGIERG